MVAISLDLDPNQSQELRSSVLRLKLLTRKLLLDVLESVERFPRPIRKLLRGIVELTKSHSRRGRKKAGDVPKTVVRDLVFLRFFSPALTFPEQWGLIKAGSSTPQLRRNCILLSKALQMAANQVLFDESNILAVLNESIQDNQAQVRAFFKELLAEEHETAEFDYEVAIPPATQAACLKELLVASAELLRTNETTDTQTLPDSAQSGTAQSISGFLRRTSSRAPTSHDSAVLSST